MILAALIMLAAQGATPVLAQTDGDMPVNAASDTAPVSDGGENIQADSSETIRGEDIEPSLMPLALSPSVSMEMEIIQWPDGSISLPVKAFAALLGIDVQQADRRLLFVDPLTKKRVEIDWEQQHILVNDVPQAIGSKPIVRNQKGFIVADDVYIEQSAFAALLDARVSLDTGTTSMTLNTPRKLNLPSEAESEIVAADPSNIKLIKEAPVRESLIDKASIRHSSSYGLQESQQPVLARIRQTNFNSLVDTTTVGVNGSVLGLEYSIKPSFSRFNNKFNLQTLDWNIQKTLKNNVLSLGSTDAGLSPLTSPNLTVWGFKAASKNATTPFLSPQASYEFSGKATTGNQVSLRHNQRTVQTVIAQNDHYDLDPVYLQGHSINELQVVETDAQHHETILEEKKTGYFPNMLPRGETGYSAFLGRTPLQFYPLLPDQNTPIFMPQTEKWLAGGRLFYGVNNRLTVGVATASDQNFGKPRTYYSSLNPLAVDLTGFSSYLRDPNFFSGQNISASMRYQLTDQWLLTSDVGLGRYNLQPGSGLTIDENGMGKAGKVRLESLGRRLSWYVDAFHYDTNYYTPSNTLYGNALYDKRGVGSGISGSINLLRPIQYNLSWSRYQTNLSKTIAGGLILASHWQGSINVPLTQKDFLIIGYSMVDGDNKSRQLLQRNLDATFRTQSLPFGLQGEVRASHYFSNTVFFPSPTTGTNLSEFTYENNSLDTALTVPFTKSQNQRVRLEHRVSTFVNYGSLRGNFQYKRVFLEPFVQRSYGDKPQLQNQIGVKVGYQFPSGARLSVSYYKIVSSFQGAGTSGAFQSKINTSQFYVDFSDVFGMMANGIKALGPNAESQGIITGTVFADAQADGKYNKQEPGVKQVRMLVDRDTLITTDERGHYLAAGLSPGYHTLEILPEHLPLTLSTNNPIYKIKVKQGKTHQVDIPLLMEGGSLSGHLELVDGAGKELNPKQIALVLLNEQGESVKYTMVNEQGDYRFSNVPAGRYTIELEARMKKSGRYKTLTDLKPVQLSIPDNYETLTEIHDLDFKVLSL